MRRGGGGGGHLELLRRFLTADRLPDPEVVYNRSKLVATLVNAEDPALQLNATCAHLVKVPLQLWGISPFLPNLIQSALCNFQPKLKRERFGGKHVQRNDGTYFSSNQSFFPPLVSSTCRKPALESTAVTETAVQLLHLGI